MKEPIDIQILTQFLDNANKSTYANKDALKSEATRLESEDYHFEQEDLTYHDTYFGARDFIGAEIVYKSNAPVWGMNYYGYIVDDSADTHEIYDFLRKALMVEVGDIIPVRGPKSYEDGEWRYVNLPEGGLDRFTGKEDIYNNEKLVYRADYHGGFIG